MIKPIRTKKDYERALARIEALLNAKPGTRAGDELDVITTLVSAYEEEKFPIDAPTPVEAIVHRMEALGLTRKDLEKYLGSRARVSEILNGKRQLTLNMIRKLHKGLSIPAESLLAA